MRWNVRSRFVSPFRAPPLRTAVRAVALCAFLGASAGLAGCSAVDRAHRPLDCGLTGGPCACPAPACATGLPDRPPHALPGEAWCKVLIPARYETVIEQIESSCPTIERVWVPPVMETRLVPIELQPACTELIRTPGATRLDRICTEVCPERSVSRVAVGKDACGCTVKSCETVTVPAVQGTCTREVCVQSPETRVVHTPAVMSADMCQVEVAPGSWREVVLPGVRESVTRIVCVSPERWEWQRNDTCTVPVAPRAISGMGSPRMAPIVIHTDPIRPAASR